MLFPTKDVGDTLFYTENNQGDIHQYILQIFCKT